MTEDRSFERAARSWLEGGPTEAPDRAVDAALLQIQTTNQERDWNVPWRTRPMNQTTRLLAGAAAIAVVLIGGAFLLRPGGTTGPGAPSPSVTATAAASPSALAALDKIFISDRYGYTVAYPGSWTATAASKAWTVGSSNTWDSGMNDQLRGSGIRFSGASQALAKGQTAAQWLTAYAAGGDMASWPAVTIDGVAGRIDYDGGPANGGTVSPGGRMFDAVVVSGSYAYNFNMDGKVDRATFEALLATVKLPILPTLSETFTSKRHGHAISYPTGWRTTPAAKRWTGLDGPDPAAGNMDVLQGSGVRLVVESAPLGSQTSDGWRAAYAARFGLDGVGVCDVLPKDQQRITIGDTLGYLSGNDCPGDGTVVAGDRFFEALAFVDGRVYLFWLQGDVSRAYFQTMMNTVQFNAAAANDKP